MSDNKISRQDFEQIYYDMREAVETTEPEEGPDGTQMYTIVDSGEPSSLSEQETDTDTDTGSDSGSSSSDDSGWDSW
ncbi:hypothetical protein [Photobacterium lutimaris]|uniref:Uncharacterized protein n=1 Tax=Photobacterium lutimaris TaxID=388278 RepID=A0A2T3J0P2_9GAMM|nr:hypothetical protein [Photobacterium lutimaris]PSU34610.1 hypothetical protein C9I99_05785 [Photobacterium lutimaris]TDR71547.1 hypothetical protein DFP78_11681 [Photobacterium lutimaris]